MKLISYSFSNFQSFLNKAKVNLLFGKNGRENSLAENGVNRMMLVAGPNGSGKTALLKPIMFMCWFISDSFYGDPDSRIPVIPHFSSMEQPSTFSMHFLHDESEWHYELACSEERVLYEVLRRRDVRFRYVFVREWNTEKNVYQIRQQNFGFPAKDVSRVRKNASLISTAAQYNVPVAVSLRSALRERFFGNVNILGRGAVPSVFAAAEFFSENTSLHEAASSLLSSWDMGLKNVTLREVVQQNLDGPEKQHLFWLPVGIHSHNGQDYEVPFPMQASGTQAAFILLMWLLSALKNGGIAVIDEIEKDLHPHMLRQILDLFLHDESNPLGAQIIFTSHSLSILNELHKSQIMLVEKNRNNESEAYRLDEMEGIRNDDNFYAKYMAGAYGAIPVF